MAEDTQNPFYFDAELLSDHELIDKIKDILENVCGKLPILSSEPLDNALSNLDKDNKLPSILKLSTYLESWAINHSREENQRVQERPGPTQESLSFSQEEKIRQAEFEEKVKEFKKRSADLEKITIENEIIHRMFRPNADGTILSMSIEKSLLTPAHINFSHEKRINSHQQSSNDTASNPPVLLKGKEKEVSGSSSEESVQSTPASSSPKSSPGRSLRMLPSGIRGFRSPVGSRPGNVSPWYKFSDYVSVKLNALYPPYPGTSSPFLDPNYVRAHCPTEKQIWVSLSAFKREIVQRISPTELVYPNIEVQGSNPNDGLKDLLPLPLPVTLEELFYGVTKKVTFFKMESNQYGKILRNKIHLDVNVKAGMYAGKEIEIHLGRGWPFRRLSFLVYEIEHPVFSRQSFDSHDYSNLQLYCQEIGSRYQPKSIQVTFIDGEQKLIHLNDARYRDAGGVELEKKGMPINAVKNGPRGGLTISPPKTSFDLWK